jgi:hypothetical protein
MISTAAGAGGSRLLGWLGGPWGAAAMTGLQLGSKLVGRGRRAADRGVQAYENPFGKELADIVRRRDAGDIEGAKAHFGEAWGRYRQGVAQGFAQGGKDALVAQQSLDNPLLRQTANEIANSLGLGGLSWGRDRGGTGGAPNLTGGMGSSAFPQPNTGGIDMKTILKNLATLGGRKAIDYLAGKGIDKLINLTGYKSLDPYRTAGTFGGEDPMRDRGRGNIGIIDINLGGRGGGGDPSAGFKAWLEKNFPQIAQTGLDVASVALQQKLFNDYNEEVKRQNFLREGIGAYQLAHQHRAGQMLDPVVKEALNIQDTTPYQPLPESVLKTLSGSQRT